MPSSPTEAALAARERELLVALRPAERIKRMVTLAERMASPLSPGLRLEMEKLKAQADALREDVVPGVGVFEFQLALGLAEKIDREAQSRDTTTLLAHLSVVAQDVYGYCHCPRCEGHKDLDCSLCRCVRWLDENGEAFTYGG